MIHTFLLISAFGVVYTKISDLSGYSKHIRGRCFGSFDCEPEGNQLCIPLTSIRDCIKDCPNGADEECGEGEILCDQYKKQGCGKCVKNDQVNRHCSDRRWKILCAEPYHFKCVLTPNCVFPQWINDGIDDCVDGSDEDHLDPCLHGLVDCKSTNESETTSALINPKNIFDTEYFQQVHDGKCVQGEYQCHTTKECIQVAFVLDGISQCKDKSDENYCEKYVKSDDCPNRFKECSFDPTIATFVCGCPPTTIRSKFGICLPVGAPIYAADCADLQHQYRYSRSGKYNLFDWKCANPAECKFPALCDMQIFGGGWTVIMQRLNTSINFKEDAFSYEQGFYIDESNFWIGNERLYRLTNRPQCANELLLRLKSSDDGRTILVRYSHFVVCEKFLQYRLNLGPLVLGKDLSGVDDFLDSRMAPFLVNEQTNCSTGGGWWMRSCTQKGILTANNIARGKYPGLTWNSFRLSAMQMLIRPRAYIPPSKTAL